jgi:hypothetical protein
MKEKEEEKMSAADQAYVDKSTGQKCPPTGSS